MEAYRRLAAVTNIADVEDVRAEWIDRYGPPPKPAVALLDVARLRAEALRLGIRAVSVQKKQARFDGLELRKSQEARLQADRPQSACPARCGGGSGRHRETRASWSKGCSRLLAADRSGANGAGTIRVVIHTNLRSSRRARRPRRSSHERLLQHPARRGNGHVHRQRHGDRPSTSGGTTSTSRSRISRRASRSWSPSRRTGSRRRPRARPTPPCPRSG